MVKFLSPFPARMATLAAATFFLGTGLGAVLRGTGLSLPLLVMSPLVAIVMTQFGVCLGLERSPRTTAMTLIIMPFAAFPLAPLSWWIVTRAQHLTWTLFAAGTLALFLAATAGRHHAPAGAPAHALRA